jgi:uncharacterized membrane protein
MAARQTRRRTRRVAPSSPLPRPVAGEPHEEAVLAARPEPERVAPTSRRTLGVRAHHVIDDLSYVRTDLITIAIMSAISVAFVVAMAFVMR